MITQSKSKSDLDKIITLLKEVDLPTEDIETSNIHLFVKIINNTIVGVIGLEQYDSIGLLRSLAVDKNQRNERHGKALVAHLINHCKANHIKELYLLTTTAETYFQTLGFHGVDRKAVPKAISKTQEFSAICPSTAIVMRIDLDKERDNY